MRESVPIAQESPSPAAKASTTEPTRRLVIENNRKYPERIEERGSNGAIVYAAKHLLLQLPEGHSTSLETLNADLSRASYTVETVVAGLIKVGWQDTATLEAFDRHLAALSAVLPAATISRDYVNRIAALAEGERLVVNDPAQRLGVNWLYENGYDAEGFTIAVIDSGMRTDMADLEGARFTNPAEQVNGQDDDGNGFIDDLHGWDFLNDDNLPEETDGHGTHVALIIAADGFNGTDRAGLAPKGKILPLKFIDTFGQGFDSDAIKAIHYARDIGAKVINASWGREGAASAALQAAIESFVAAGGIFVTSAGNDSADIDKNLYSPASLEMDGLIVVGGLNSNYDNREGGSNFGKRNVDILAPYHAYSLNFETGNAQSIAGTSYSAPMVAAMAACLWHNQPALSNLQVIDRVLETAVFVPATFTRFRYPGHPDLRRMFSDTRSPVPYIRGYTRDKDPVHVGENLTLTFDIESDEHFILLSGAISTKVVGKAISFEAAVAPKELQVEARSLLGAHAFGTVLIDTVPSAPYLTVELPTHVELTDLSGDYVIPISEWIRGDRPYSLSKIHDGAVERRFTSAVVIGRNPESAGDYELQLSNATGTHSLRQTVTWEGMQPVSIPPRDAPVMRLGDSLLYYRGAFLRFDGQSIEPLVGNFPLHATYRTSWSFDDVLIVEAGEYYASTDGMNWVRMNCPDITHAFGRYRGMYAVASIFRNHLYLLDPATGAYQTIRSPESLPNNFFSQALTGGAATDGETLLNFAGGKIWHLTSDLQWEPVGPELPSTAQLFHSQGSFIVIPEPGDTLHFSSDGLNWESKAIKDVQADSASDIFVDGELPDWSKTDFRDYNDMPAVLLKNRLYGYDWLQDSWLLLADFATGEVIESGLSEAFSIGDLNIIKRRTYRWLNGIARSVQYTPAGVYATDGKEALFSRDLIQWRSLSSGLAATTQLNGDTYMLDNRGLFQMRGATKGSMVAESLMSGPVRTVTHLAGHFIALPETGSTWYILDPEGVWQSSYNSAEVEFFGASGQYRIPPEQQFSWLTDLSAQPSSPGHFHGRTLRNGSESNGTIAMEDARKLPHAVYDAFPFARYSPATNWFKDPTFGDIRPGQSNNWILSKSHGSLAIHPVGEGQTFLHDNQLGWLLFDPTTYPAFYCVSSSRWLQFATADSDWRAFYDFGAAEWVISRKE